MTRCKFIIAAIITIISLAKPVYAVETYNIMAIVNGTPITNFELNNRMDIIIISSGLQDSIKLRKQLAHQSLQTLINEILQKQDAKQHNIRANKDDLEYAVAGIEKHNSLPKGGFGNFAAKRGLSKDALIDQIKAQIIWKKILNNLLSPRTHVSDFEIEDTLEQLSAEQNITEVYLSEILLPIADGEAKTLQTAKDLIDKINNGTNFSEIAKQFSSGSTASEGGIIGWIPQNQLGGKLKAAVKKAESNSIVPAIVSEDGVRIVKIGNRRNNSPTQNKEKVHALLMQQKLELESKRYMKDIRNKAFIEIRI